MVFQSDHVMVKGEPRPRVLALEKLCLLLPWPCAVEGSGLYPSSYLRTATLEAGFGVV